MNRLFKLCGVLALAVFMSACVRVLDNQGDAPGDGAVNVDFAISGDSLPTKASIAVSASETSVVADLSEVFGINGLILTEEVTSMDVPAVETKGTPVYTENFVSIYDGTMTPIAVYETESKVARTDLKVPFARKDGTNTWSYAYEGVDWTAGKYTYFFSAPSTLPGYVTDLSSSMADKSISFKLPVSGTTYPTTATEQQDLLFTCKDITVSPGGSSNNDLLFYHVFTAVKFKLGNTDTSFTITKVELTNMYTSGTCTVKPNYPSDVTGSNAGGDADTKSSKCSKWDNKGTRKTFSQTFVGTNTLTSENSDFAPSFYNGTTAENNLVATDGDTKATATFMCIPMAFSSETSGSNPHTNLNITFKDSKDQTKTVSVDLSTALDEKEWKAGQLYTYSLTVNDVTVEVTDEVSGDTVSNLLITNTGNMDGYIRATITANWVKDMAFSDGTTRAVVVHELNRPSEVLATYFQNLAPTSSWKQDGDLFFYYKYPVHGGQHTNVPLFTSYTVHGIPASAIAGEPIPIDGCYIQLTVSAQIVSAKGRSGNLVTEASKDNVQNAWAPSTEVIGFLSTTPESPAN